MDKTMGDRWMVHDYIDSTTFWCTIHCFHFHLILLSSVLLSSDPLENNLPRCSLSWQCTMAQIHSNRVIDVHRIMSFSSLSSVICMLVCSKKYIFFPPDGSTHWHNYARIPCKLDVHACLYVCGCVCIGVSEWERICVSDTEGELWFSHQKRSIPSCELINIYTRDRAHDLYSAALQLTHSLQTDVHTCCAAYISSHPTHTRSVSVLTLPTAASWYFLSHKFHFQSQLCWCTLVDFSDCKYVEKSDI